MGLIQKAVMRVLRTLSLADPVGWQEPGSTGYAGEAVTESSVLAISAAWACINLLAGTISSLPLMVYRTQSNGARHVDQEHPLYRLLHSSPNAEQTALDFWEFMVASIELRGNAFARKSRGAGGRIVALYPISPSLVSVSRHPNGDLRYRWSEDGVAYDLTQEDVLHIRGFGGSPLGGLSTLAFGRHMFSSAIATDMAAGSTFRNGLRPPVAINYKTWLTSEQRAILEDKLVKRYMGATNSGRPFINEGDSTLQTLTMSHEDAQLLESRGFSVEEICRWFGVPPFMVGHTEKTTSWGTGLEQQILGFQKFTLRRRLKRIEQALMKQLLSPQDRAAGVVIEFNLEGLLRGDSTARAHFYTSMLSAGVMMINEVRALENLPPVEGGDVPRMQAQNIPITQATGPSVPSPDAE